MKDKTNIDGACEQSFIIGSFVVMLFPQQICCSNSYIRCTANLEQFSWNYSVVLFSRHFLFGHLTCYFLITPILLVSGQERFWASLFNDILSCRDAMCLNLKGTQNIIKLCRGIKHLEVVLYLFALVLNDIYNLLN